METFYTVLRSLSIFTGSLLALIYFLIQFWQQIPQLRFEIKTYDYIFYIIVSLAFGLGLDNYYGLLAFVPMLVWKFIARFVISKKRVRGIGAFIEVEWRRFTPRGFQMPKEAMDQMGKLPSNLHFLIPRFVSKIAVKMFLKNLNKNVDKMPRKFGNKEEEAFALISRQATNISRLEKGKTERINLPFGELKVTRL